MRKNSKKTKGRKGVKKPTKKSKSSGKKPTEKNVKKPSKKDIIADIIKMMEKNVSVDNIPEKLEPYLKNGDRLLGTAKEKTDKTSKEIMNYVRTRPLESISIAFLVGFFLASLKK